MKNRIGGIIFDLDGTLIDSARSLQQILNDLLARKHIRSLSLDEVKGTVGDGLRMTLDRACALANAGFSESERDRLFDEFLAAHDQHKNTPDLLYPHVGETLQGLRKAGVKTALCPHKLMQATTHILDELALHPLFDVVTGGDSFSERKPSAIPLLGVIKQLALTPETTVMVGDSQNDIKAAKAANIKSIAVSYGYAPDVHALGADLVISSLAELSGALEQIGFCGIPQVSSREASLSTLKKAC